MESPIQPDNFSQSYGLRNLPVPRTGFRVTTLDESGRFAGAQEELTQEVIDEARKSGLRILDSYNAIRVALSTARMEDLIHVRGFVAERIVKIAV